jgi:hypothetical protein
MHRRNNLNFTKYDLIKILLVAGITLLGYFCYDWYQSRPSHIIQHDYLDDTQYQEHLANSRVDDILAQLLAYLSEDETIFFVSPSLEETLFETEEKTSHNENEIKKEEKSEPPIFSYCGDDGDLCPKVQFKGDFTEQQKVYYFSQMSQAFSLLDESLTDYGDLYDTLQEITLYPTIGNRRGSSSWYKITFHLGKLLYQNEFFQVFSHEMGHIIDLGLLQGSSRKKSATYTEFDKSVFAVNDPSLEYYALSRDSEKIRKKGMKKKDFCSGYGMSDPFEDFAECHNLYLNHQDLFRLFARSSSTLKDKYNFLANLYEGMYFSDTEEDYDDFSSESRVWDTTRISEG